MVMVWLKRAVIVSLVAACLDLGISGVIGWQQHQINENQAQIQRQAASTVCWDDVLTVAIRDHLTTAERAALLKQANHCADLTLPSNAKK